jgi:hypothetical protein
VTGGGHPPTPVNQALRQRHPQHPAAFGLKPDAFGLRSQPHAAQFARFNPGMRSNSRMLLVTRVTPRARACAAIKLS